MKLHIYQLGHGEAPRVVSDLIDEYFKLKPDGQGVVLEKPHSSWVFLETLVVRGVGSAFMTNLGKCLDLAGSRDVHVLVRSMSSGPCGQGPTLSHEMWAAFFIAPEDTIMKGAVTIHLSKDTPVESLKDPSRNIAIVA